ncbi:hypothetical protein UlMin_020588 [Ulmus minor]
MGWSCSKRGGVAKPLNLYGFFFLGFLLPAIYMPPKAIRGGIPICFPLSFWWKIYMIHGFTRNRLWSVDSDPPPFLTQTYNKAFVDLILKPSEEDMKIWPHSYEFRLRVALGPGGDLMLTSRIRNTNTDGKPAIHIHICLPYVLFCFRYQVIDIYRRIRETLDYLDNFKNMERCTEQGDALTLELEVDKIYLGTPTKIAILDHEKKRTFVICKDGLPDDASLLNVRCPFTPDFVNFVIGITFTTINKCLIEKKNS